MEKNGIASNALKSTLFLRGLHKGGVSRMQLTLWSTGSLKPTSLMMTREFAGNTEYGDTLDFNVAKGSANSAKSDKVVCEHLNKDSSHC